MFGTSAAYQLGHLCTVSGSWWHPCPSEKGYSTLATNLLQDLNMVPLNINVSRLNDGSNGIEETLTRHKAKWHKTYYILCNATKVERARKSIQQTSTLSPVKHHLRSKSAPPCPMQTPDPFQPACLFCDGTNGNLHKAETMSLDARVRGMALDLRDSKLLAKLSTGDMIAIEAVYHKNCLKNMVVWEAISIMCSN
jgi:hypothetical protein